MPGSFTHQQLAILLGLAKQTPFTVMGVVASSAAAAATPGVKRPLEEPAKVASKEGKPSAKKAKGGKK